MRAPERRPKNWYIILIVILSLIFVAYLIFVVTRFSGHTIYNPFTKQVFKIDSGQVSSIKIINGTTGNSLICRPDEFVFVNGATADSVVYEDQEKIKEIVDILNGFRYSRWKPDLPSERDGYSYMIYLYIDEKRYCYQFDEESVCVKDIWFWANDDRLEELTKLVQGPPEEVE